MTGAINNSAILDELSRVLRSQVFRNSDMLRNFLSFIVQEELKDDGIELKQYSIAVHAFDRSEDFDPTTDPIVRIQAGRLRRNLDLYYREEGARDRIRISLPKGTYRPSFSSAEPSAGVLPPAISESENNGLISLAVVPIRNLSSTADNQHIVDGFTQELLMELSHSKDFMVIRVKEEEHDVTQLSMARFSLDGSIRFGNDVIKISLGVTDNRNMQVLWSYQEKFNEGEVDLIQVQEEVATAVAQQIAGLSGVISEKMFADSKWEGTHDQEFYATYMHFYVYNKNPTEQNANSLLEKVHQLVEKRPDFAAGWAVLTNLYADAYMFGLDGEHLDLALQFGKKAIDLQPNNQVCQVYYAWALQLGGHQQEADKHFQIALQLNPHSLYYPGAIGWAHLIKGDMQAGHPLVKKSMELDYQHPRWFHIGTSVYYLGRKEYHKALLEAEKIQSPDLYWDWLMQLVTCEKLSLTDKALQHLEKLTEVKPDFFERPEAFVRAMIKFEPIVAEILESVSAIMDLADWSLAGKEK